MEIEDDVQQQAGSGRGRTEEPAAQGLVLELVDELNSLAAWDAVVQLVLERSVIETRSDRGVISWIDGKEMIVAGCLDPIGERVAIGSRWPLASHDVGALALASGRPEAGAFGTADLDGISPALRATYSELRSVLVVPVSVGGEQIAVLCVSRRRAEEYTSGDGEVLDVIARVGAQPLRAARLDNMLGAALAALAERLAGAESVERVKTDVLRLASHELRSPLTVLHGYLSLVRAGHFGDIPEPLRQVMSILDRRTEEMKGLVNHMLVSARSEGAVAGAQGEQVDLRSVVREAADAVEPTSATEHRVHVDVPDRPVLAYVDPEQVGLAVRNLIDNAVKYSPGGGEVVCSLSESGGTAKVRVADHGLGIAPEDRHRLFTRFGRVVTPANSHIPGIGLGLYFSREVARRHGGEVALLECDGPGTVFELTMPSVATDPPG